jgi:predicted nucleotide-binding protein
LVVCGEDKEAQEQLEEVLNELQLGNKFLASKNEEGLSIAQVLQAQRRRKEDKLFGIVLLTADYQGTIKTNDIGKAGPMYGPGLMLETGLLVSAMKLGQVVVLAKEGMTLPIKIPGVRHLIYENNIQEVKLALAEQMQKSGLNLGIKKTSTTETNAQKPTVAEKPQESIDPSTIKTPPAFI